MGVLGWGAAFWRSGGRGTAVRGLQRRYQMREGRWDEFKLLQLGYKQELRRAFTWFNCTGIGVSLMSCFAVYESYSVLGLTYGGPVVMTWGVLAVGLLTLSTALSMGELLSAYPVAGGVYYWSWTLAPEGMRNYLCWMTGWLNLLGQITLVAGGTLSFARGICTLITMHTVGEDGSPGYQVTEVQMMMIFAAAIIVHSTLNCLSQPITALLISFGALWHMIATPAFVLALVLVAPTHQNSRWAWLEWTPNADTTGIESSAHTVLVGLLMSQWTLMGFDVVSNISEETVDADLSASMALPASVVIATALAFIVVLGLNYSLQSLDTLFSSDAATGGSSIAQVAWDVFAARYGSGRGSIPLMYIPSIASCMCVYGIFTSSGRMLFAFSRDGAMLGGNFFSKLSKNRLPVRATWLMAVLSFAMGLPACFNVIFYNTITAVSVVCLMLSFGIPIALRIWYASAAFLPGPFDLGLWSRPIGAVACGWILTVAVVFCLPTAYPLDAWTFNYTPCMLAGILLFASATWWAPKVGGVHWFTGPKINNVQSFGDLSATPDKVLHPPTENRAASQQDASIHHAAESTPQAWARRRLSVLYKTQPTQPTIASSEILPVHERVARQFTLRPTSARHSSNGQLPAISQFGARHTAGSLMQPRDRLTAGKSPLFLASLLFSNSISKDSHSSNGLSVNGQPDSRSSHSPATVASQPLQQARLQAAEHASTSLEDGLDEAPDVGEIMQEMIAQDCLRVNPMHPAAGSTGSLQALAAGDGASSLRSRCRRSSGASAASRS